MPLNLSIKKHFLIQLREGKEPFYNLAPDVVGSINNAYPSRGKKIFVVDFNTIDNKKLKLITPFETFSNFQKINSMEKDKIVANFLNAFLRDCRPHDPAVDTNDEMLGEMVDEFGDLYGDKDDMPANIRSAPGMNNVSTSDRTRSQMSPQYSRLVSPLGYGGVVW